MLSSSERVCKGETNPVCLNPSSQTIIVAEGSTVRISLGSEGLYPCAENNCESDKIQMAHQRGPCTLDFNRDSDRMERGNFYGTGCDQFSWNVLICLDVFVLTANTSFHALNDMLI